MTRGERLPRVAVLSGAGISAGSGVPTFRGAGGLWRQYDPQELATPQAFARDPKLVWEFYDWRRQRIATCRPNPAHLTLVEMENALPDFTLVTQNVDGLHTQAGSRRVLCLHGDIWTVRCTACTFRETNRQTPLAPLPPRCPRCGQLLRPDVVWFGEALDPAVFAAARRAFRQADLALVIGTSALVYPAAELPYLTKQAGRQVFEFNTERTPLSALADAVFLGPSEETLPAWWADYRHRLMHDGR